MKIDGLWTALITPFKEDYIDLEGLKTNLEFQIQEGTQGVVLLGSTGEAPTLSEDEKRRLISYSLQTLKGRIPLMLGIGSSSTRETIDRARQAEEMGANALLVATPSYNRPTQDGLLNHFTALANSTSLPILLYNIPTRTACKFEIETLVQLAQFPNIIGVKDASGDFPFALNLLHQIQEKKLNFQLVSGEDSWILPLSIMGGSGAVSATGNLTPASISALLKACQEGNLEKAKQIHTQLMPLFMALAWESNPIPIKAAMSLVNMPAGTPRLPLTPLHSKYIAPLKQLLFSERFPWLHVTHT